MFLHFVLKERDCSLRLDVGEQSCSERNAPSLLFALAGGGARSNRIKELVEDDKIEFNQVGTSRIYHTI
jgi:hypothetical protein